MAISGLFTFAWTTGLMFDVVHSQHTLAAELKAQRTKGKSLPGSTQAATADETHDETVRKA
jgi:hypothetical protein